MSARSGRRDCWPRATHVACTTTGRPSGASRLRLSTPLAERARQLLNARTRTEDSGSLEKACKPASWPNQGALADTAAQLEYLRTNG
jgi:hypothetical protein